MQRNFALRRGPSRLPSRRAWWAPLAIGLAASVLGACAEAVVKDTFCVDCLTIAKTSFSPNEGIAVSWRIPEPSESDWICYYEAGQASESHGPRGFSSLASGCGYTHDLSGEGSFVFSAPLTPGVYDLRLFLNGQMGPDGGSGNTGYTNLRFSVVAPATCGDTSCGPTENAGNCPGDCAAANGDGFCTHDENAGSAPADCPPVAGDGLCTHAETPSTAADDCPATAGDGLCTHQENADTTPQDCPPVTGDGLCTHAETCHTVPADCGACPIVCGDGTCSDGENASNCAGDCGPVLGDGFCTHDETCMTAPADCGACPATCGDGVCNGDESAGSCPAECPAVAGDGLCTHSETASTTPQDCPAISGDGFCTHAETAGTTPQDCPAVRGDGLCTHTEDPATAPEDCPAVAGDGLCTHSENASTTPQDCPAINGDGLCTHDEDASTAPADCPAVSGDGLCTHNENASNTPGDCPAVAGDGLCTHSETCTSNPGDCGQCPTEIVIFADDFENGFGRWAKANRTWATGPPPEGVAVPGSAPGNDVAFGGDTGGAFSTLQSPVLDTAGASRVVLSFQAWIDEALDVGDHLKLKARTSSGTWVDILTLSESNGDDDDKWHSHTVDLTAYAHSQMEIMFRVNTQVTDGEAEHVAIDDVQIVVTP